MTVERFQREKDLVGKEVIVQNPDFDADAIWRGNAIAFISAPSLVIDNGIDPRITLNAVWANDAEFVVQHKKYRGFDSKWCYCNIAADHDYRSLTPYRHRD